MSDQAGGSRPLFKFDGTIPAWGILLLGLSFAWYVLTWQSNLRDWQNDLESRMKSREAGALQYRAIVDGLVKDQSRLVQLEVELKYIRAGIDRLENRLPATFPRVPSADALK